MAQHHTSQHDAIEAARQAFEAAVAEPDRVRLVTATTIAHVSDEPTTDGWQEHADTGVRTLVIEIVYGAR
ncbi:MAG: hypothetical protein WC211_01350 [Dehalococcoidia bacterium]